MYVRKIDDQVLTFQVSGKLWMRSLVMRDVETKTEWSHLLGRGMAGELKGRVLKPIISDMLTWEAWLAEHPETTVLDMPAKRRGYSKDFYRDPTRFLFGFEINGKAWSLSMAELMESPVHSFQIDDQSLVATYDKQGFVPRLFSTKVGEDTLAFVSLDNGTMKDKKTSSVWKITTGEAVSGALKGTRLEQRVGIMSFRKAWENFHPKSQDVTF